MTQPRTFNFYDPISPSDLAALNAWLVAVRAEGWTDRAPDEVRPVRYVTMRRPLPPFPLPLSPGELGLDVSHWQNTIDWPKVKAAGYRFVYVKVSQGVDLVDSRGAENRRNAHAAGLHTGCYHYFEHDRDGGAQAVHFSTVIGEDVGHLTPAVDVEPDGQPRMPLSSKQSMTENLKKFLDTMVSLGYKPPVIYTSQGAWPIMTTLPGWAKDYPLWAADWTDPLDLPQGWTWARYQQKGKRPVSGVVGEVDWNNFRGLTPTAPPPSGQPLYRARAKALSNLRDRAGNQMLNPDGTLVQVPSGAVVDVWEELASIGPNALGQTFVDRRALHQDGRNLWAANLERLP